MKLLRVTICWLVEGADGSDLSWKSQSETWNRSELTELPTKSPESSMLSDAKQGWTAFSPHVELLMQLTSQTHDAGWRWTTTMF